MLYGISGRDCALILTNWSTYASDGSAQEYGWFEMPLLREITVPLSFFTTPIRSIGAETYASITTTVVPARMVSAVFILQSGQLANPMLFPFSPNQVSGLPPFFKQGLRVVFAKPFLNNYAVMEIPEAIPTRWELQIRENAPATITVAWSFNTANLYDKTIPTLVAVNPNDEYITIRNLVVEFAPPVIPPHGVRGLSLRVNAPVSWLHRVGIYSNKIAYDFTINRVDIEVQLDLTPDASLWFWRQQELAQHASSYLVRFTLIPERGLLRVFQLVPHAKLNEGAISVGADRSLSPTVSLRSQGLISEVGLI